MTVCFKQSPQSPLIYEVVAIALSGVVYTEYKRLHVKCSNMHFIYKFDGSPVGWYARNAKTFEDIYLGEGGKSDSRTRRACR